MVRKVVHIQFGFSALAALSIVFSYQFLHGASFQVFEQSASSLGYAHADMASLADDACTAWYNPAGITRFEKTEFSVGVTNVYFNTFVDSKLDINPALDPLELEDLASVYGPMSTFINFFLPTLSYTFNVPRAKGDTTQTYGYFHAVQPLLRRWRDFDLSLGLSVASPWGWDSDYSCTDLVSYAARSSVRSVAIAPCLSLRAFGNLSLGLGVRLERMSWLLSSEAIRCLGINYKMKKWFWGWNISLLYELHPCLRFGTSLNFDQTQSISGSADFSNFRSYATANIKLPNSLSLGTTWLPRTDLTVTATLVYTDWSRMNKVDVVVKNSSVLAPNAPALLSRVRLNLKDTYLTSLGLKYDANEKFSLRTGLGFETASTKNRYREIRFHDAEHYFLSVGCNYQFNGYTSVDIGYMFTYLPAKGIRENPFFSSDLSLINDIYYSADDLTMTAQDAQFSGTAKSIIHSFGLQFNCGF